MITLNTYNNIRDCTVQESIDGYIYELKIDAVSLDLIVSAARRSKYEGEDKEEFVRLHIKALQKQGHILLEEVKMEKHGKCSINTVQLSTK